MAIDSVNYQQAFYFGRSIGFVLTMLNPKVRLDLSYEDVFNEIVKEEEELRKSDSLFDLYKLLFKTGNSKFWEKYFQGLEKGIKDMMKARGLDSEGNYTIKIKRSKQIIKIHERILKYLKEKKVEEDATKKLERFDNYKNKLFIAQFNLVFKMSKIKNPIYMQGIAEDIAKKIAKDPEITSKIGIIMSDFCNYISNFTFKVSGVNDIPEQIIGRLPSEEKEGEEYLDEEVLLENNSMRVHRKYIEKGIDIDKIREEILYSKDKTTSNEEDDEENYDEELKFEEEE